MVPSALRMCLPTSVNLEISLTDEPTSQPDLDNPSLRCSSQIILGCVKVTIKVIHHWQSKRFHTVESGTSLNS